MSVQTQISDYDNSIMKLIWASYTLFEQMKDKWEYQIYKKYIDVHSITHVNEDGAVIAYSQRTESD